MADIRDYKDLLVWQKAMDLVDEIYLLLKHFPKEEEHALASQLRRAVTSVPSNIAEGQKRKTAKEFSRFLSVSAGSLAEVETQLEIALRQKYLNEEQVQKAFSLSCEIGKMLNTLSKRLLEQ